MEEIRSIGTTTTGSSDNNNQKEAKKQTPSDRWKRFSSTSTAAGEDDEDTVKDKPERYNGVLSWDRLLQEWSEDIQEYLDKIEAGGKQKGYPMSTFGRAGIQKQAAAEQQKEEEQSSIPAPEEMASSTTISTPTDKNDNNNIKTSNKKSDSKVPRPIPAPRKEGEAVLPHTDVSDKSKRVWIVTTASLPWMTGTGVNPLLRAAYMVEGRDEAGGSVTLMLPWLERKEDQDDVYGPNKTFDTPEQQEEYIRGWLKNSAKMVEASEKLNIRWYTAWQNKAENSLYSMGDIVADISADDVDIMVLEEPEHLNWYRAPGQSWTNKFKHVVGIIHTNYFVYAQEQPGALIRVSYFWNLENTLNLSFWCIICCLSSLPHDWLLLPVLLSLQTGSGNEVTLYLDVPVTLSSDY